MSLIGVGCKFAFQNVFTNSFQKSNLSQEPMVSHNQKESYQNWGITEAMLPHNQSLSFKHSWRQLKNHTALSFKTSGTSKVVRASTNQIFINFHNSNIHATPTTHNQTSLFNNAGTSHVARPHPIHSFIIHFSIHSFIIHFSGISAHTMAKKKTKQSDWKNWSLQIHTDKQYHWTI